MFKLRFPRRASCAQCHSPSSFQRRTLLRFLFAFPLITSVGSHSVLGRPEGVNKPNLLPKEKKLVIDLEHYLTSGQLKSLERQIEDLERRSGFKLRVLTQRYPDTPGLAIKDYWQLDSRSVVMVADFFGNSGNLLKFNVGSDLDGLLPPRYWSLLSSKYGNKFFVEQYGEDRAILDAADNIFSCILQKGCATP
ncbi:Thylakoid lumenal 15.0 kDa protein 2, chloroplastic [Galdieria sulphuraria]|nr:Thylakoid lumenal 15.0 kDa protein 2, chloroplastic [Galdieria sulphuraria]